MPDPSDAAGAEADAAALVAAWFPDARAAWLGGSVVVGGATAGSDLDVTVLLPGPPAPFRDARRFRGWPVELFVHTETSLAHYLERDAGAGRPTMVRLVGASRVVLDTDGSGARWREHAARLLERGPDPLAGDDLRTLRYAVTDLADDTTHAVDAHERLLSALVLADETARLLLRSEGHWWGRAKWVARELGDLDARAGTQWRARHEAAVRQAAAGDAAAVVDLAHAVLDRVGGPLFEGFRLSGDDPDAAGAGATPGERPQPR